MWQDPTQIPQFNHQEHYKTFSSTRDLNQVPPDPFNECYAISEMLRREKRKSIEMSTEDSSTGNPTNEFRLTLAAPPTDGNREKKEDSRRNLRSGDAKSRSWLRNGKDKEKPAHEASHERSQNYNRGAGSNNRKNDRRQSFRESTVPATTSFARVAKSHRGTATELWWKCIREPVPVESETHMVHILLRWDSKERGMIKAQKPFRLKEIKKGLKETPGIRLDQALSLRRHHMKLLNPHMSMSQLKLGSEKDIKTSADIFEQAVEDFLISSQISFLNEEEQKARMPEYRTPTPDFLLTEPVVLKSYLAQKNGEIKVIEERKINWIEAKMFYGASTIPTGSIGAVGSIVTQATKYLDHFGPGAIVFMQGYGDGLAAQLAEMGVTSLASCAISKKLMEKVWDHQRTWCARDGQILP